MISSSNPSDYTEVSQMPSENESIISGFTDENICGAGATCRVYQMNLQGLHVAVKRLRDEYVSNPIHEAAFRKEYSIGRQLKHDALPVYKDMRVDDNYVYIIMDFVDGRSVSELLETEEGRQYFSNPDNVRRFLSDLVGVVGYLHRKGVIHCDIKPANIMLRHSDRGVMLIDLDKAYCDTLDTTHGGTSGFSNPLNSDEKPTARKDFAAIGMVLDYISEITPNFPGSRFRLFRRECDNLETISEKLIDALRPQSHIGFGVAAVLLCLIIICVIGYYMYKNSLGDVDEVSETEMPANSNDSIISEPQHIDIPDNKPASQEGRVIIISDFDSRMEKFIMETNGILAELSSGTVTDREISEMMSEVVNNYTSAYNDLLTELKKEHPNAAGIDVELALARASENSHASSIMQQFTQAVRDTIVARHPESSTDY